MYNLAADTKLVPASTVRTAGCGTGASMRFAAIKMFPAGSAATAGNVTGSSARPTAASSVTAGLAPPTATRMTRAQAVGAEAPLGVQESPPLVRTSP